MASPRYVDLLKQGFSRSFREDVVKVAPARRLIACDGCRAWHYPGKHLEADPAIRRANAVKSRAERAPLPQNQTTESRK